MKTLDPKRTERQLGLVRGWGQACGRATLEAQTGFGKSRVGIEADKALRTKYPTSLTLYDAHTIVVAPTTAVQNKWEKDLLEEGLTNFRVYVINTIALGSLRLRCRLLILDEIHRYTGEHFRKVFERVTYDHVLGLTATLPPEDDRRRIIEAHAPVFDRVSLEECLENGWTSPFSLYNLAVHMTDEEKETYEGFDSTFSQHFAVFSGSLDLMYEVMKGGMNKANSARAQLAQALNWEEKRVYLSAVNANRAMNARKNFLNSLPSKIDTTLEIIKRVSEERKVMTFAQTTEVPDALTERLREIGRRALSYHSKVKGDRIGGKYIGKDALLDLYLRRFALEDSGYNILNAAKALDEGIDIALIDLLVVIAGSAKARQALQRLGRGTRFVEGKHTIEVDLYAEGTVEKTALRRRQQDIPQDNIHWVSSVREIPL